MSARSARVRVSPVEVRNRCERSRISPSFSLTVMSWVMGGAARLTWAVEGEVIVVNPARIKETMIATIFLCSK